MSSPTIFEHDPALGVGGALDVELSSRPAMHAQKVRLHHLDWVRAILICFAVYLHVAQVFGEEWPTPTVTIDNVMYPEYLENSTEYALLNQDSPDWRQGYSRRYIMQGRQITIPMLFWISGYALGLGKEKALSSLVKILIITVIGMTVNGGIYAIGPKDQECNWWASRGPLKEQCDTGTLINFGIGTGATWWFNILFQFWFTVMMMVFLAQVHCFVEALRKIFTICNLQQFATIESDPNVVDTDAQRASAVKFSAAYFVITALLYFGLAIGWTSSPEYSRLVPVIVVIILELPFMAALIASVNTPAEFPHRVRLFQYLAAFITLIQFTATELRLTDAFDGGLVLYYHFFKQFFLIGFVMSLTRKKTKPVMFAVYPVMIIVCIFTAAPTNYFKAGQSTYPYFPNIVDRLLWSGGSLVQVFVHDRLGIVAAESGVLRPLIPGVGMGALAAYIFHVPVMVLFEPMAETIGPAGLTFLILLFFMIPLGIWEASRKKNK